MWEQKLRLGLCVVISLTEMIKILTFPGPCQVTERHLACPVPKDGMWPTGRCGRQQPHTLIARCKAPSSLSPPPPPPSSSLSSSPGHKKLEMNEEAVGHCWQSRHIVTASMALWSRRPPRERKISGSNPACTGIFLGSSHTSDIKIATQVAILPGAWRYRVSAGTGWLGVSILWLGEMESLACNFYLSVAACKIVWVDPSLRHTSMLLVG